MNAKSTNKTSDINLGFSMERGAEGIHLCYIFSDEAERKEVMTKYLESGLSDNEKVSYFGESELKVEIRRYLGEMGIPFAEMEKKGQLTVAEADDIYCPDRSFSPERMLSGLKAATEQAKSEGFARFRATGEMGWALKGYPGSERLIEYESKINILIEDVPFVALCQYDAKRFDGGTILKVLQVHPMMVVYGKVVKNPYYKPARQFLSEHNMPNF